MGWTIPDGNGHYISPSGGAVHEVARAMADILPAEDWRTLQPILGRRAGDPFTVSPAAAATAARVMRRGLSHWRMPGDLAPLARRIADAAEAAARSGQPWEWR